MSVVNFSEVKRKDRHYHRGNSEKKIVYFINQGDPSSGAAIHQVRKLAASLNFFQYLCFDDLKDYTGWKS